MRVVQCKVAESAAADQCLIDTTVSDPQPAGREVLVAVEAVSVNPVDAKVRRGMPMGSKHILGWDAAGTVVALGPEVQDRAVGDEVYYAGNLTKPGSNAELQCVDERIVGLKPTCLDFAPAAALPLTSLTAWELLFDRFSVDETSRLLVIGAAGGVGSMLTQLASQVARARVIGTASRPESREWVESFGAEAVVDHSQPLRKGLAAVGIDHVTEVASVTHSHEHFSEAVAALEPQGAYGLIDDPKGPLDIGLMKRKSLSLHWEFMFTRSMFNTPDIAAQGQILNRIAELVDLGTIRSTINTDLGPICAENLIHAHQQIESGTTIGKIVLSGWA